MLWTSGRRNPVGPHLWCPLSQGQLQEASSWWSLGCRRSWNLAQAFLVEEADTQDKAVCCPQGLWRGCPGRIVPLEVWVMGSWRVQRPGASGPVLWGLLSVHGASGDRIRPCRGGDWVKAGVSISPREMAGVDGGGESVDHGDLRHSPKRLWQIHSTGSTLPGLEYLFFVFVFLH